MKILITPYRSATYSYGKIFHSNKYWETKFQCNAENPVPIRKQFA
jgi:hypothetical protein